MARQTLLVCGILSSVLYVAMTVLVAMQWEAALAEMERPTGALAVMPVAVAPAVPRAR